VGLRGVNNDVAQDRDVTDTCEYGNELPDSINCGEFVE
jgi:hypothetical protein